VPFAVASSRPKKSINTGRVTREPPPANVLTTPAKRPIPRSIKIEFISRSMTLKVRQLFFDSHDD
jgi:hypothetical protein